MGNMKKNKDINVQNGRKSCPFNPTHLTQMHQQSSDRVLTRRYQHTLPLSDGLWVDRPKIKRNGTFHA